MIENIFIYIEILLPRHKCVTLPGFGAFILNKTEELNCYNSNDKNKIAVPSCYISFNQNLQHDDGVLASYLQFVSNISYEKASKELINASKKMHSILLRREAIACGTIGKMKLTDKNIVFTQNEGYILPQHYGLDTVNINTVTPLDKDLHQGTISAKIKRKNITITVSAAAIALLLILPSTKITNNLGSIKKQEAGYLASLMPTKNDTFKEEFFNNTETTKATVSSATTEDKPLSNSKEINIESNTIKASSPQSSKRLYYIIVGGSTSANGAKQVLDTFIEVGFNNAKIVSSADRYRVYVASFENKQEAEGYLLNFRNDNPKYKTAWLHSQRK